MDITVSLQIKITFDGNKKVSVGNVATAVEGTWIRTEGNRSGN